jgi:transcriptional regulator with XRE-family HTH domain
MTNSEVSAYTPRVEREVSEVSQPTRQAEQRPRNTPQEPLHRVAEVRKQQGVSLRTAARHMKRDIGSVREQEKETADLRISDLLAWQQVLDVPLVDLIVDNAAPLSQPVMERARLVRMMKTAAAIAEKASTIECKRLARMLMEQLMEVMPELAEVSPWHSVGQRRSLDEVGRIVERRMRDDFFSGFREE